VVIEVRRAAPLAFGCSDVKASTSGAPRGSPESSIVAEARLPLCCTHRLAVGSTGGSREKARDYRDIVVRST
jgi:hypothetical protein